MDNLQIAQKAKAIKKTIKSNNNNKHMYMHHYVLSVVQNSEMYQVTFQIEVKQHALTKDLF